MVFIPTRLRKWRKQTLEELPGLFSSKQAKKEKAHEEEREELLKQIGQLKVEVEWLKKKSGILHSRRRGGSST
jgi:transposase